MERDQILGELKKLLESGEISKRDLLALTESKTDRRISLTNVLYVIGGLVVISGLIFLIMQAWDTFSPSMQIAISLGTAIAFYISAVLLSSNNGLAKVSSVFFIVSGILTPIGIAVTLHHLAGGDNIWLAQLIMSGLPAIVFAVSFKVFKKTELMFLAILHATWALYSITGLFLDDRAFTEKFYSQAWAYLTMTVGAGYLLMGWGILEMKTKALTPIFYFLGSFGLLAGGLVHTYLQEPWIFIYYLLVAGTIYLSTILKSRSLLVISALALIANLTHTSFKYFANSLGWPLALVIAGLIIIGVAFGTVEVNKKFIGKKASN